MSLNRNPKAPEFSELSMQSGEGEISQVAAPSDTEQMAVLAGLIVQTLNLEIDASQISPDDPLYGDGLGLDSIDILEIALIVSQTYGVNIKSGDENNANIFRSLRNLNSHIQRHRTK